VEPLPGLGRRAERRKIEVGLIRGAVVIRGIFVQTTGTSSHCAPDASGFDVDASRVAYLRFLRRERRQAPRSEADADFQRAKSDDRQRLMTFGAEGAGRANVRHAGRDREQEGTTRASASRNESLHEMHTGCLTSMLPYQCRTAWCSVA
jgi:hypothetical protein